MSNVIDKGVVKTLLEKTIEERDALLREAKVAPSPGVRRKIREKNEEVSDLKRLLNS